MKKTITIVVPTYNESENIMTAYQELTQTMEPYEPRYHYEILFIDNCSTDDTQAQIRALCQQDAGHIKAIFNARNFGQTRSHFYGLCQAEGDCAILMHADLQNPPSVISRFIEKWEQGAKVVVGIKDGSKENPILFFLRSCYYRVMHHISEVEQIQHFSDFELLDRSFLEVLRKLDDPNPYLRGIVSELGFRMERVHYQQNKRERGKTKANFWTLYDFAMNGITAYSKSIMRLATWLGTILSLICILIAIVTFVIKLLNWDSFQSGIAAISVGVFFLGSIQLFFIGLLGEYILGINTRTLHRPLVIEEERINISGADDSQLATSSGEEA